MPKRTTYEDDTSFEDDTSILPRDMLLEINNKVPVKSLLGFKSVSKRWNVKISDNEFKKAHRDQSKALGHEKLLVQNSNVFEFRDLESSQLIMIENPQFPREDFQRAEVLCSCDGLVLLRNRRGYKNYVLWNPSTRDQYRLSWPDKDEPRKVSAYGMCYDSSVGDFKVIFIYDLFYAVYSLDNNSWTTKISFPYPVQPVAHDIEGISTEGRVFWSLRSGNILTLFVERASTIMYFDVKSDEVKKLPTPDFVGENDYFCLTRVKGCLRLFGGNAKSSELEIRIMEQDGSWEPLMNICNLPCNYKCKRFVEDKSAFVLHAKW